ncbi:hypothetical protein MTR67_046470 [Solanum verrucosum]|uniref:F-box domain-containing protein n=1 Tax=Solanum verrucosum TaxID=315347 RepID=A0AAF0UW00_SOLVR|nr:hypothetical protein MTR67_046470 [Solanum verrucosum]
MNREDVGKSVLGSSNNNTEQMDVDQALTVHFEEGIIMNILSRLSVRSIYQYKCVPKFWNTLISDPYFKMKHFNHAKNDQTSQKFLISHLCSNEHRFNSYCCPISSVQMVEDAQKLDRPLSSKPFFRVWCGCDGLVVVLVSGIVVDKHPIHLLWNPSIRESWSALCTIQDPSSYQNIGLRMVNYYSVVFMNQVVGLYCVHPLDHLRHGCKPALIRT